MKLTVQIKTKSTTVLPPGYSLYQLGDDYALKELFGGKARPCASGGCPSVVPFLDDPPDVIFDMNWQFFLYAINEGMRIQNITSLMDYTKAFMNRLGTANPNHPVRNYITGNDLTVQDLPATDKFRSMCLNTHLCREQGNFLIPLALDGAQPPPMKPGKARPTRLQDVSMDDYLYTPKTHPWFFIDCTNVKLKPDKSLDYGPFYGGTLRNFEPFRDGLPHTFFPFVTRKGKTVQTPKHWWRKLSPGENWPSAVRR